MNSYDNDLQIQPGEHILKKVRKYWFVLFKDAIGIFLVGTIPPVFVGILLTLVHGLSGPAVALFVFGSLVWLLITWMALATVWTNYFLDLWIITEHRVIYIEQVRFFVREIRTLPIERMQDIDVRYNNILETLLDFGTLRVQSAGAIPNDIMMPGVPHPHEVRNIMFRQADALGHTIVSVHKTSADGL